MNSRLIAVLSYITIFGWIVSLFLHKNNPQHLSNVHLKNALGLHTISFIAGLLSRLPVVASVLGFAVFILWVIGVISALSGEDRPLPFIGQWLQNKIPNL